MGSSTSAPMAVRSSATTGTARSRIAIDVSMKEPPQTAATHKSSIHERRLMLERSIAFVSARRAAVRHPATVEGCHRGRRQAVSRMPVLSSAMREEQHGQRLESRGGGILHAVTEQDGRLEHLTRLYHEVHGFA